MEDTLTRVLLRSLVVYRVQHERILIESLVEEKAVTKKSIASSYGLERTTVQNNECDKEYILEQGLEQKSNAWFWMNIFGQLRPVLGLPLVMSMPWLSWANKAECWGDSLPVWGLESSSVKTGGGPGGGGGGGGGQGALDAGDESKRDTGAMGPCGKKRNDLHCGWGKLKAVTCFRISSCSIQIVHLRECCTGNTATDFN